MMRLKSPVLLLLASTLLGAALAGCSESPSEPPRIAFENAALFQSWTHSYEENEGSVDVYRPSSSREWVVSHFRGVYSFDSAGTGSWLVLHAADAHYVEETRWELNASNPNVISVKNPIGQEVSRFEIVELRPDVLRVKVLNRHIPRCNYRYGKVDVTFHRDLSWYELEDFLKRQFVPYEFHRSPVLPARLYVEEDSQGIEARLEQDERIRWHFRESADSETGRAEFRISFEPWVVESEAQNILTEYGGWGVLGERHPAVVRFEVGVQNEERWIQRFLERSDLVTRARVAGATCPPEN